jgi:hypothetical protein
VYAPGRASGREQMRYEDAISTRVQTILKEYNSTLLSKTAGFSYDDAYVKTKPAIMTELTTTSDNIKKLTGTTVQTVSSEDVRYARRCDRGARERRGRCARMQAGGAAATASF